MQEVASPCKMVWYTPACISCSGRIRCKALLVKAHWEGDIEIAQLCLLFYPHTNISDWFPSHFIRIRIFQIDFPSILYFIFVEDKWTTSLSKKKDELNYQIFHSSNWCSDICKIIFETSKLQFHHEQPCSALLFWAFFSAWSIFTNFNFFCSFAVILDKFSATTSSIFFVQNMSHNQLKNAANITWWVYWMRNRGLLLQIFCIFFIHVPS